MSKGNDGERGGIGELRSQHQRQCVSAHEVESLDSKGNVLAHIKQKQNSLAAKLSNSPMLHFGPAKRSKHKANTQQQHLGIDEASSPRSAFSPSRLNTAPGCRDLEGQKPILLWGFSVIVVVFFNDSHLS